MKHRNPTFKIDTFGEYEKWDRNSKAIPKIIDITTEIFAKVGAEFGYVLQIKKGKGVKITFEIIHPPFCDEKGNIVPSFKGEHYIKTNDYKFYLGDCIWEPIEDKRGEWELLTFFNNKVVAQKTLLLK